MAPGQSPKQLLRGDILASRRVVPQQRREAESQALAAHVAALGRLGDVVCAYVPVGSEPGSAAMLDVLREAGATVYLPVARTDADGVPTPLQWGHYRPGSLVSAPFGLREPPPPWLPPGRLADAAVVLVPALAVDRRGTRLGRGAGFYDRSLPLADPAALRVAVVRDDELLAAVPGEPHDVAMTHALTPGGGLVPLGEGP
jgi:5-formyltetrahydrofolate cyclo-ligase